MRAECHWGVKRVSFAFYFRSAVTLDRRERNQKTPRKIKRAFRLLRVRNARAALPQNCSRTTLVGRRLNENGTNVLKRSTAPNPRQSGNLTEIGPAVRVP